MVNNLSLSPHTGIPHPCPYAKAVGTLQWITIVRPNIAVAVSILGRFASHPSEEHWKCVFRVLQYLKGTPTLGLVFGSNKGWPFLSVYSDADWGGDVDTRQSTSRFAIFLFSSLIVSSSRRQKNITKSSLESEYVALSSACSNLIWVRSFLHQLDYDLNITPVYCDNQTMIVTTKDGCHSEQTRHIDTALKYGQECVANGTIDLLWVKTDENPADMFTKPLGFQKL